jgi:hypothetical protein
MSFSNIPLLWEILELIVQDWTREATPLQTAINNSSNDNERIFHTSKAFIALQPHYLECLFSYAVFFVSLEGAYDKFYEDLNMLNRKSFLKLIHDKKPKPTDYIEKVRTFRNISVAHISSKKAKAVYAAAALWWQPMTLGKGLTEPWDLNKLSFGGMKLTLRNSAGKVIDHADDLEIKGIPEIDTLCGQYLDEYDRVCANYLNAIHAKLPVAIGNEKYYEFKAKASTP